MKKKKLLSVVSLTTISIVTPLLTTISCSKPTNLTITAKTKPRLMPEDVIVLQGTDHPAQLIALGKLFGGTSLTSSNQANFMISVDTEQKIVSLIANPGFSINKKPRIDSTPYVLLSSPIIDLKINANQKQTLTQKEVDDLKSTDISKQLPILQKLFIGITAENQKNFKFEIDNNNVVTLTANKGFSFGLEETISAPPFTLEMPPVNKNLNINPMANAASLIQSDINTLNGTELPAQLIILKKLFTGPDLKAENQAHFKVSVNEGQRIVTLTCKNDYTISGKPTLNSLPYNLITPDVVLNITKITSPKLLNSDIALLEGTNTADQLLVLKKLFNGIDNTNISNITFKLDKNKSVVTLTANKGYIFNQSSSTLESDKYIIEPISLTITKVAGTITISEKDITNLEGTDSTLKLASLNKLFTGSDLKTENLNKFTIEIDKKNTVVILKAINGYIFNKTEPSITSNKYTLEINPPATVNLIITAKPAGVILSPIEITILNGTDTTKQLPILEKLFQGTDLKAENQDKFTIIVDTNKKIVSLKAKPGYTIDNKNLLPSNQYKDEVVIISLNITKRAGELILSATDIANLSSTDNNKKLTSLQKLFEGPDLKIDNINKFNIEVDATNKKVILKPIANYTINGANELVSNQYKDEVVTTVLNITAAKAQSLTEMEEADLKGNVFDKKLVILKKLFNNIDQNNQNHFDVLVADNKIVTLTAKDGYTFASGKSLSSPAYTVIPTIINLEISAKQGAIYITEGDISILEGNDVPSKLNPLQKLFDGKDLTSANLTKFKIKVDKAQRKVILTPEQNYTINNKNMLDSQVYIVDLQISLKAKPALDVVDLVDVIGQDSAKQLISLQKLFTGVEATKQPHFDVSLDKNKMIVTLTAKEGYSFVNANFINSNVYTITNIDLQITTKIDVIVNAINGYGFVDLESKDKALQLPILERFFAGVDTNKQNNFTVSLETPNTIKLIANSGYSFGDKNFIESIPYKIDYTNLYIKIKTEALTLSEEEHTIINQPPTDANKVAQDKIVAKFFTHMAAEYFNYFTYSINGRVITLEAKKGFAFSPAFGQPGAPTLSSTPYKLDSDGNDGTHLNIEVSKNSASEITYTDIFYINGNNLIEKVNILSKFFSGINSWNIDKFTINTIEENDYGGKIQLTAKDNWLFGNASSSSKIITSKLVLVSTNQSVNYIPVSVVATDPQPINQAELDILKNSKNTNDLYNILNRRFFSFPNQNDINRVTVRIDEQKKEIIIRSNFGTYFGDPNNPISNQRELRALYKLS
ncbi:MAG: hypothetical protein ACRCRP_03000 [Metamycoplasmataceae bacterium]